VPSLAEDRNTWPPRKLDTIALMAVQDEMLDLLRRDPAFREELRRQLLTDEVLGLPALVRELVEAQRRTGERIDRLAEQIQRQAEQIQRQAEQIQRQAEQIQRQGEQIQRLAEEVRALVSWQRGEAGRRDGERYERELVRRAPVLFNGGQGGTPDDPWVRQRLATQLRAPIE
jgi:predicted ribosome quality control (RQC) complex YloA/Tae2 family protein